MLWWYMLLTLGMDLTLSYIVRPMGYNRFIFININMIIEWVIVMLYIRTHLPQKVKRIMPWFIGAVVTGYFTHLAFTSFLVFNGLGITIITGIIMVAAMYALYTMLENREVMQLETSGYFWANVGFIVFFSGNFVLFLFVNYFEKTNANELRFLWPLVHNTLLIIYRLIMTVALTRKTI